MFSMSFRRACAALGVVAVAGLGLTACGSDSDSGATAPASETASGAFPVTIETMFGDVTVESEPERVVALGWGDAETALALGVQPVGAADWLAFGGEGVGPWAEGLYDEAPEILGTMELSYEEVAALEPDLILDVTAQGDEERFNRLSQIAPTIAPPEGAENYLTSMTQEVEMVSTALGVSEKGDQLLDELSAEFAAVAEAHAQFDGKTITVAAFTSEGWGAYVKETTRVEFMENLGFVNSPTIDSLEPDGFTVSVASERVDLLDADVLFVFPIYLPASDVTSQPLFPTIPAVADGRAIVLDDELVSQAFAINSVLSVPYALEKIPSMLESIVPADAS